MTTFAQEMNQEPIGQSFSNDTVVLRDDSLREGQMPSRATFGPPLKFSARLLLRYAYRCCNSKESA